MDAEVQQEAAEMRRVAATDISLARVRHKRPRLDEYRPFDDESHTYDDEGTLGSYNAGQHILDSLRQHPELPGPGYGTTNKYGFTCDETDITVSSVLENLRANGKRCCAKNKLNYHLQIEVEYDDYENEVEEEGTTDILAKKPSESTYYPYRNKIVSPYLNVCSQKKIRSLSI